MVESIKEIKAKCYSREIDSSIPRYLSLYITWLLLKLKLSANFVSILGALCAGCGAIILINNSMLAFAVAAVGFLAYYMLDYCDGNIARYTETASLGGLFLDDLMHFYIGTLIKFMLAISIFYVTEDPYIIFLGLIAAYPSAPDFLRFFAIVEQLRTKPDSLNDQAFIKLIQYDHYKPFEENQQESFYIKIIKQSKIIFSQPNIMFLIIFVMIADILLSISIYGSSQTIKFVGFRLGLIAILALLNVIRQLYMTIKHMKELRNFV